MAAKGQRALHNAHRPGQNIPFNLIESGEAQFIQFWLTSAPALPEPAAKAARAQAGARYDSFVAALGRWPKLKLPDDVV